MKKLLALLLLTLPAYLPAQTHIIVGNINNTRYADGAPGGDWVAKVANRLTDLNCQSGEVWVSSAAGTALPASVLTFPNCPGTVVKFTQGAVFQHIGIVIPAGCRGCGLVGTNNEGAVLQYRGTGTAITFGASTADTFYPILRGIAQDMSLATGSANGFTCVRCQYLQYDSEMVGTTSITLGTGVSILGTGSATIHADFWQMSITGNWTIGFDSEGPTINTSNAHVFHHCNIARTTARPGTGTIGFKYGVNSGDGKVVYCDVESYDVGYEIDGKELFGNVRSEANTIGINFGTNGANTYENSLWQASFTDTTPYVLAGFSNSVFDPLGFVCSPNVASGGICNVRNTYDAPLNFNLQAGKTAEQTTGFQWQTHLGVNTWFVGQTTFDDFVINTSGVGTPFRVPAGSVVPDLPNGVTIDGNSTNFGTWTDRNNADVGYFRFFRSGLTVDQLACNSYENHSGTEKWRSCNSAINDRLETDGSGNPWLRVQAGTKNVQFYGQLGQGSLTCPITQVAIDGANNLTITCANTFAVGQIVTFANLGTATFLTGFSTTVATASGTQFTGTFTHAAYGPTVDTGTAANTVTDRAGILTITNPATTVSYTWGAAYSFAPVCPITPLADTTTVGVWWPTITNTSITINVKTTPGSTIKFSFGPCMANPT